jgi:hypothetical protein
MLKINDGRKKVYIVLGRNSSGTSFLSKALVDQGVDMGNTLITDPPVYENELFLRFNEKVLSEAGGDWKNIPPMEDIERAFNANKEHARSILYANYGKDKWGWKDPRNSITGHLWIRLLKEIDPELDIYLICIFRDTDKVARSLAADNYTDMVELSRVYNESVVRIVREFTNT